MRASQYLITTKKESPADAEVISHQLMLRAGMIRKVAAGLYSWLPLGLRVFRKVENIVRQEMDRSGALEVMMPQNIRLTIIRFRRKPSTKVGLGAAVFLPRASWP